MHLLTGREGKDQEKMTDQEGSYTLPQQTGRAFELCINRGGLPKFLYMDIPAEFRILTFTISNFVPPIRTSISYKKHPILLKLGDFYGY